jgi:hypothetical protein
MYAQHNCRILLQKLPVLLSKHNPTSAFQPWSTPHLLNKAWWVLPFGQALPGHNDVVRYGYAMLLENAVHLTTVLQCILCGV